MGTGHDELAAVAAEAIGRLNEAVADAYKKAQAVGGEAASLTRGFAETALAAATAAIHGDISEESAKEVARIEAQAFLEVAKGLVEAGAHEAVSFGELALAIAEKAGPVILKVVLAGAIAAV